MNKKGMEMTFQTIVYAALALFMLGVLIFVFSDQIGINLDFIKGLTSCEGECASTRQDGMNCYRDTRNCPETEPFCCKPWDGDI